MTLVNPHGSSALKPLLLQGDALASERAGVSIEIVERYPFLVGDDPASVPGIDALAGELGAGTMLVATTDPMHHGHAYGTPAAACLAADRPVTFDVARASVESQLATLSTHRYGECQALAARDRSDFRDTGPVLAHLLGRPFRATIHDLALVDYASALGAATPSWVAAWAPTAWCARWAAAAWASSTRRSATTRSSIAAPR